MFLFPPPGRGATDREVAWRGLIVGNPSLPLPGEGVAHIPGPCRIASYLAMTHREHTKKPGTFATGLSFS